MLAARPMFAQTRPESIAVSSSSGLRAERHGNPERPAVALFLPRAQHPCAVIEMPEHAWRKATSDSQPEWFYKMYSSDPALKAQVEWSASGSVLAFTMQTPLGYVIRTSATLVADGLNVVHEVSHGSVRQHAAIEAVTCVKLYRPFTDVFLDRTFVHLPEGLDLIASETPGRASKNAEEWLPCRYIARVGKNAPKGEYRVERLDGVARYFKSKAADSAFLATESSPAGWTAATFARNCDSVFTNPARTCHHADPTSREITDGRASLRLKVYLLQGGAEEAWRHVSAAEGLG